MKKTVRPVDSLPHSTKRRWNGHILMLGIAALAIACLVGLSLYFKGNDPDATQAEAQTKDREPVAELVSATGLVLAGKSGRMEWNQISIGARLMVGDLIQTDKSGTASIRYSNGNTVSIPEDTILTVQNSENGSMEISAPAMEAQNDPVYSNPGGNVSVPDMGSTVVAFNRARAKESGPFIRLDRIIPFGRSLELIGRVDAGSRLSVNRELVEISGDGSFKHFTNPFPASVQTVNLLMKVTDLSGRTSVVSATYGFDSHN